MEDGFQGMGDTVWKMGYRGWGQGIDDGVQGMGDKVWKMGYREWETWYGR